MLIEQSAYTNRWRRVSPAAKGLFTAGAFIAVFAANSPLTAAIIASLVVALTVFGAGIAPSCYLRVATPALFFFALGSLSLAFSLDIGEGTPAAQMTPRRPVKLAEVGTRSLGSLAALLFLVLTTPLIDLIACSAASKYRSCCSKSWSSATACCSFFPLPCMRH
jgi:cobalt/nickel transport system permease protein